MAFTRASFVLLAAYQLHPLGGQQRALVVPIWLWHTESQAQIYVLTWNAMRVGLCSPLWAHSGPRPNLAQSSGLLRTQLRLRSERP